MLNTLRACLYALLLMAALPASADVVRDLYSASVPMADQSGGSLNTGAREALSEVLVKVSGTPAVLDNPQLAPALAQARSHVQQYVFLRAGSRGDELQARFEFDPDWVRSQVLAAGAPLWTANRPRLLLWLVMEGPQGRYFVNNETSPEFVDVLRTAFGRRGVPVQFPLFDLNDAASASPDEVWRLDVAALRSASLRYDAQHILGGRLGEPQAGRVVGDWAYLTPEDTLHRAITVESFESFAGSGAALVADDMAARFALAPTAVVDGGLVVWISGVQAYADYAAVMGWLQRLELVESARLERIVDDRLELRLLARADASQLATLFALNRQLQPSNEHAPGVQLSYQWQGQ